MFRTGPDILALAADMPEPATSTEDTSAASETTESEALESPSEEVGSEPEPEAEVPQTKEPAPAPPVQSTKLGWAASLKALEDAGQGELAAHAKRIQADATRKAQEASQLRAEAEAMLAEARALKARPNPPVQPAPAPESIDPWDAEALRAMAQHEARTLLEAELAPLKAAREAEVKAQAQARKEAELDSWLEAHPDFASDESMQAEVAELIQATQAKGRFIHLDDAYTVITSRRVAAEAARLQAEAKARSAAKVAAVSKTQAANKGTSVAAAPRKPVAALSAAEIMALAKG
jgi:DNA repair exonuclease SbcCD ATPase subunit